MEDDWDLHAVVRSCSSTSTAAAASSSSSSAVKDSQQDCSNFTWPKEAPEPRKSSSVEDLHELWKPFFNKQQILPVSPLSVLQDLPPEPKQEMKQQQQQQLFSFVNGSKRSATSQNPRSKKRKNHSKKVCHVPAESLSSDAWSWRKYGQKPIKGSPYPRGYYRCSTLKGCMARKQVERNRSDPGMFIVTYTGDHSHPMPAHRNSLAGSTRPKPAPASPEKMEEELIMEEEVDDEDDDDFFAGLEDFAGGCSPENQRFPWVAAGGG